MNNMILSNLKKILDKTFLNIFPKLYLGLTRAQDSNDRFIFGHDIIKDKLKSNNINVLDAGCGGGNFYYYLKSRFSKFEYLGLEFDNQKIKSETYKKDNFKIISHDLRKGWSFGEFDFVWSSEVIEHILDDQLFFQNLVNSTIKDGYIVYTSGVDGKIKEGVPVGKVFLNNDKKLVKFFTNFTQINFVKVNK